MRKVFLGEVMSHIILTDVVGKKDRPSDRQSILYLKEKQVVLQPGTIAMALNEMFQAVIKPEEERKREVRDGRGKKGACLRKRAKNLTIRRGKSGGY